jgi:transcriptional regulator with XRE-family HTH domain
MSKSKSIKVKNVNQITKERLTFLERESGIKQAKIAELLGVSRQTVYKWETGESAISSKHLTSLARIFNVDVAYLTGKSDYRNWEDQTRTTAALLKKNVQYQYEIAQNLISFVLDIHDHKELGKKATEAYAKSRHLSPDQIWILRDNPHDSPDEILLTENDKHCFAGELLEYAYMRIKLMSMHNYIDSIQKEASKEG